MERVSSVFQKKFNFIQVTLCLAFQVFFLGFTGPYPIQSSCDATFHKPIDNDMRYARRQICYCFSLCCFEWRCLCPGRRRRVPVLSLNVAVGWRKCLRCACVRSGVPCLSCLPGVAGNCHNTLPRGPH